MLFIKGKKNTFIDTNFDKLITYILEGDYINREKIVDFLNFIPSEMILEIKKDLYVLKSCNQLFYSYKSVKHGKTFYIYEIDESAIDVKLSIIDINNSNELSIFLNKDINEYPIPIGYFQTIDSNNFIDNQQSTDYYLINKNTLRKTDSISGTKDISLIIGKFLKRDIFYYIGEKNDKKEKNKSLKKS